jgi:non-specific serine/threonine protein kinase
VEAVVDFAPAFGTSPETAVDLLSGLASKSLTSVDQSASPPRYRLLESVREFALEQLKALGEERRARDAHLDYVLRLTEAAHEDMLGERMRERIALLTPEHGNIDSASEYAAGMGGRPQAALQIPGRLTLYFKSHGAAGLGMRLCARALDQGPSTRSRERALALLCRGINLLLGKKVAADVPLLEAVGIAREVGDEWAEAYACGHLALWLLHAGDPQAAIPHLERSERLAEARNDDLLRGLAGLARGWLYLAQQDIGTSLTVLRSVRHLSFDFHQHHFIGMYIGLGLFRLGDYAPAAAEWYEAMRNAIAVGHLRGISGSVEGCAYLAERLGRPAEACRYLSAAEQMRQRAGSPLLSFWYRHHEDARTALRATLGAAAYEACVVAGTRMHVEDVMNEAGALLREFAAAAVPA